MDPAAPYVDPDLLAEQLGLDPLDPRVMDVCLAASQIIDSYYGEATVTAKLVAPPWPPPVAEAALTIATDLWRRPSAPGGYFQVVDYVGRLTLDPTLSVAVLLDSIGRLEWPIA